MALVTALNLAEADEVYAALLKAHEGLSEAQSHAMNAQLVLILANHIGNRQVLEDAFALARKGL